MTVEYGNGNGAFTFNPDKIVCIAYHPNKLTIEVFTCVESLYLEIVCKSREQYIQREREMKNFCMKRRW